VKKFLLLVVVLAALAAIVTAPADARGHSCSYRASKVVVTIDGYGNNSYFCNLFARSFSSGVRVYGPSGTAYCAWKMRNPLDIPFVVLELAVDVQVRARMP
jgi:hypothetical protein